MAKLPSLLDYDTKKLILGFESLYDSLEKQITRGVDKFPPHDIIKSGDNQYTVVMAVAGFDKDEIEVLIEESNLIIKGSKKRVEKTNYIYQGISTRSFEKEFTLAENIVVETAKIEDGLLKVNMKQIVLPGKEARKLSID